MSQTSLEDIARKMRKLDIAMLTTVTLTGEVTGRPMSNNGDVAYEGESFYFTFEPSRTVADIENNPRVALAFEGDDSLYISVTGKAVLIRDKAQFAEHWVPDLDKWFDQGIDTPGLVLVKVMASRIKMWDGEASHEWTAA